MTQNNNSWRKTYFTLLAGQAISFISSGILQMAIIFYLVAKTNSAIILTAATLIGFLPQACLGPFEPFADKRQVRLFRVAVLADDFTSSFQHFF